jgi:hypothetical protein
MSFGADKSSRAWWRWPPGSDAAPTSLARVAVRRSTIVTAVAVAVALASAWHSALHVWDRIAGDHAAFTAYSPADRIHAPASSVQVDGQIFDWYAQHLARGDRFYVQVDAQHDPGWVRMLAGYYLLPAVEVESPDQATVVISYFTNPNTLGIHFVTQTEAGLQPIYVSRISAP